MDYLSSPYRSLSGRVAVRTEVEAISVGIETAIPLGFIVSELVSNSLKYAFNGGGQGQVAVSLRSLEDD